MANFRFSGRIDKRIAIPYVALLYLDENRNLRRRFLELSEKKTATDAKNVIMEGYFTAEEGDVIEVKKGDMDVKWYLVRNGKLEELVDIYYVRTKDYASSKMLDAMDYLEKNGLQGTRESQKSLF